jgi:holo-[acyl-carrier protein] synthase
MSVEALSADLKGAVIGVGIDAVDIDRFRRILERRASFTTRHFTEAEQADATQMKDPAPRLAVRFAAKEAVMKALGTGIGSFELSDIEVLRADGTGATRGAPSLHLTGKALALADGQGVVHWHVSLTHTDQLAMAMVVAEGDATNGASVWLTSTAPTLHP